MSSEDLSWMLKKGHQRVVDRLAHRLAATALQQVTAALGCERMPAAGLPEFLATLSQLAAEILTGQTQLARQLLSSCCAEVVAEARSAASAAPEEGGGDAELLGMRMRGSMTLGQVTSAMRHMRLHEQIPKALRDAADAAPEPAASAHLLGPGRPPELPPELLPQPQAAGELSRTSTPADSSGLHQMAMLPHARPEADRLAGAAAAQRSPGSASLLEQAGIRSGGGGARGELAGTAARPAGLLISIPSGDHYDASVCQCDRKPSIASDSEDRVGPFTWTIATERTSQGSAAPSSRATDDVECLRSEVERAVGIANEAVQRSIEQQRAAQERAAAPLGDPLTQISRMAFDLGGQLFLLNAVRVLLLIAMLAADAALFVYLDTHANLRVEASLGIIVAFNAGLAALALLFVLILRLARRREAARPSGVLGYLPKELQPIINAFAGEAPTSTEGQTSLPSPRLKPSASLTSPLPRPLLASPTSAGQRDDGPASSRSLTVAREWEPDAETPARSWGNSAWAAVSRLAWLLPGPQKRSAAAGGSLSSLTE